MMTKALNFVNRYVNLYWNTLRVNKKHGNEFSRGADIVLVLTTRCNLHCDYCPMFLDSPKYPKFEECTIEEWKTFIENYPEWLSQIYISGGEPSLVPWVSEFINWLIERGHHVILFTNLHKPETFLTIKRHWRFVCKPTLHEDCGIDKRKRDKFLNGLETLRDKFRIIFQELGKGKYFDSDKKPFYNDEFWYNTDKHLHAMPDSPRTGKIYEGCVAGYKDGKP